MKKLNIVLLLLVITLSIEPMLKSFAQTNNNGEISGAQSGEVPIAAGGTVRATCTGNVPFKSLKVKGGFNNIIIDPATGKLQLNIEIEKETNKNILDFNITTAIDPSDVISGLLLGMPVPLNDENLMLTLSSTSKTTGETINVGNEVRQLIDGNNGRDIETQSYLPVSGNLQVKTKNNLASGFIKIAFDNTAKAIEKASEVTGEDITIDENGQAALIAQFDNIPINGSFEDLAGFNPNSLPKGVKPGSIPTGIDFNNLPKFLETFKLPEGINFGDIVGQIPPGFNLQDVIELPPGFSVEDLSKIPPFFGFTPEDFAFLPENFNLNDLVNLPPGLDVSQIPIDKITDFIGVEIPSGVNFDDIVNGILNGTIDPGSLPDINSNDPNAVCQDGMLLPVFAPFVPEGFTCPPSSSTSSGGFPSGSSSGGPPSNFDPSTYCENGMIKPEFIPFVPPGVTCPQ